MTKGIILQKTGGPEELVMREIIVPSPAAGEVKLRHTAIGLNYIDVYHRTGVYPLSLPCSIGVEAAGIITQLGDGVVDLKLGQRVAYAGGPPGAYVEERVIAADRLVPIPDSVSDEHAASLMLQGLTAHYLLFSTFPVKKNDLILFHAAAGGVGLIACQWARALGVKLIGTVSSSAKADLALAHGASFVIDYSKEDFVERVKEITGGRGVPVVYDSVGKDTFMRSLDCLSVRGMMVSFGQSSGVVEPFNIGLLSAKGSLFLTRPTSAHYLADRRELLESAAFLFACVTRGDIKPSVNQRYSLGDAAKAHKDLESRRTTGSSVLLP